jgi:DNA-binding transcriptional ArsR family regulator
MMKERLMRYENHPAIRSLDKALDPELFRALAEPGRLEILKVLIQHGPANISTISAHVSQDRSVVSRHLKHLEIVNLLQCERRGRERWYDWDCPALEAKLSMLLEGLRALMDENTGCCT